MLQYAEVTPLSSQIESLGQYARQLRKWGFAKGHIKADEWNWIGNKTNKRKLNDNKKSEFHIGGKEVHVPKLKKAKYRDAYVSTTARFSTGKLRICLGSDQRLID